MPKPKSLRDRLRKASIRHYDVLIHDQPKERLIKNFKQGEKRLCAFAVWNGE